MGGPVTFLTIQYNTPDGRLFAFFLEPFQGKLKFHLEFQNFSFQKFSQIISVTIFLCCLCFFFCLEFLLFGF